MALSKITNYLEDDWNDNSLTNRTSPNEGYFLHPSDNLISDYEGGDALKGVYRPQWQLARGTPTATNSEVQLDNAETIGTTSDLITGSFSFDFTYNTTPSSGSSRPHPFCVDKIGGGPTPKYSENTYHTDIASGGGYSLYVQDGGTGTQLISASWGVDSISHTQKLERDSYGNFELLLDGTSKGTATDNKHSESDYIYLPNDIDVRMDIDNLVVR